MEIGVSRNHHASKVFGLPSAGAFCGHNQMPFQELWLLADFAFLLP
jgi:hypothetical protein